MGIFGPQTFLVGALPFAMLDKPPGKRGIGGYALTSVLDPGCGTCVRNCWWIKQEVTE